MMNAQEVIRQIGIAFSEYVSRPSYVALLALLFLAVLVLVGSIIVRRMRVAMKKRHEVMALFQRLCDVNEVTTREKEILLRAAKWHGLSNPSVLFVRKSLLKRYIESTSLTGRRFNDFIKQVGALMAKLYSVD